MQFARLATSIILISAASAFIAGCSRKEAEPARGYSAC